MSYRLASLLLSHDLEETAINDAPRNKAVSAANPDWTREHRSWCEWDPGKSLIHSVRHYQKWKGRWGSLGRLVRAWYTLKNRFWGVMCGSHLPVSVKLGGGLIMPHTQGVIIHADAALGPNCLIFHQVTIGEGGPIPGVPVLGGHVDVGAGAKILGGVVIGDHVKVGANAVVIDDVPSGATAVGIPARIVNGARPAEIRMPAVAKELMAGVPA